MRKSRTRSRYRASTSVLLAGCVVVVLGAIALSGAPSEEKRLSIYSSVANYTLAVTTRNGQDYVGLFEVLEPLGTVTTKVDGSRWKVQYNKTEGEFTNGKTRAKIHGRNVDLPMNFVLENNRGLVPLASLTGLLPNFLGGPVNFHETSRRLFVGNVAVHFTAQINKAPSPILVMDFSSPVNPTISTAPGQLHMIFTHEPLVTPGSPNLTFDNPVIPSAAFAENNGAAEIQVNGSVPLFASFSNDGRRITIAPAPQTTAQSTPSLPAAPVGVPTPNGQPAPGTEHTGPYFAVIDASHGGEERGAALTDQLAEKDVTLNLARRLRQDLEARGITALLLRDGDSTINLDQRASNANEARPKIYFCIHATSEGTGVRIYSGLIPSGDASRPPFLDWNTAQSSFLALSQAVEIGIAGEIQKKQITARTLTAPLRPLNNITAAAIAIEIAPPAADVSEVNSSAYQESVATAVVAAVLNMRSRIEAGR